VRSHADTDTDDGLDQCSSLVHLGADSIALLKIQESLRQEFNSALSKQTKSALSKQTQISLTKQLGYLLTLDRLTSLPLHELRRDIQAALAGGAIEQKNTAGAVGGASGSDEQYWDNQTNLESYSYDSGYDEGFSSDQPRLGQAESTGPPAQTGGNRHILLTGCTGFIGPFLLLEILSSTGVFGSRRGGRGHCRKSCCGGVAVYCLVRCRDAEHGKRRVWDSLRKILELRESVPVSAAKTDINCENGVGAGASASASAGAGAGASVGVDAGASAHGLFGSSGGSSGSSNIDQTSIRGVLGWFHRRVRIIPADLSLPSLGLSRHTGTSRMVIS
jgi:hypothetical protein